MADDNVLTSFYSLAGKEKSTLIFFRIISQKAEKWRSVNLLSIFEGYHHQGKENSRSDIYTQNLMKTKRKIRFGQRT